MFYLDTSFIAPLFVREESSFRVLSWFKRVKKKKWYVSAWTQTEFASLLSRRVRMGDSTKQFANRAFEKFDTWCHSSCEFIVPTARDFEVATSYVRNYESKLRSGDALHIAMAKNHLRLTVMTLDESFISACRIVGVPCRSL